MASVLGDTKSVSVIVSYFKKKKVVSISFSDLRWKQIRGDDDLVAYRVLQYLRARFLNHVGVWSSHKYFLCVHGYVFYTGAYLVLRLS